MSDGQQRPIAYVSCTLTAAERNYAQVEREASAIIFGVCRFHQYLYGRNFTLVTDHCPLCKILGEKEGIPPLAAARMQHWALVLNAYQYQIQHTPGKQNHLADCLSHLPSPHENQDSAEKVHVVVTDHLPVLVSQIAKATECDGVLVFKAVQHGGWPSKQHKSILPYFSRRNDLSVVDGCLLWGSRVVVPKVFQTQLLAELHANHLGMSRMKSLVRSYIWWPQLNSAIEDMAHSCTQCALVASTPPTAPAHPWLVPKGPWE